MAISNILSKLIQASRKITEHPMESYPLEKKIQYLNGLVLVMNEDDEVHDTEKDTKGRLICQY